MSLLEWEGGEILVMAGLPALLTLLPVIRPSRRPAVITALGLSAASVVSIASIGMLLLPTVMVAWLTVLRADRDRGYR